MDAIAAQRRSFRPARSPAGGALEPAIDLVHLARQTMDDPALEMELLEMFDRQSARMVAQLTGADRVGVAQQAILAHKLLGSALALGARRVAGAALALEDCCLAAGADCQRLGEALARAVGEARAEIRRLTQ